jgi:hypothetical protein
VIGYQWNEKAGRRHKPGGKPNFTQGQQWPVCSHCQEQMTFYGQLDSIGDKYDLADCGLIYVFVCFDCFETKSMLQSY